MRPGTLESLRGVQAAIADTILPELQAVYAQDVASMSQMLIESIASEWDSLAEDLHADSLRMRELLAAAIDSLRPFAGGNETIASIVRQIEELSGSPGAPSLRISDLTAENDRLRGLLERLIVALEDLQLDPRYGALMGLRSAIYGHLRRVAAGGWSFWDMASFRERMAALKSDISR